MSARVADELDLGAVGRALRAKKLWVIGPTLLVAALTFAAVNLVTPRYKSEARLFIEGRENVFLRPEAEKLGERDRALIDQEAVTSQVQLVLSRDLARKVIKDLKLTELPEFDPVLNGVSAVRQVLAMIGFAKDPLKMSPEERVLEAYYERLTAFAVDKSRVISVEFTSADPELAAKAANAVAEAYLDLQQAAKHDQTRVASQWLGSEIETLRKRVAEAEGKVEAFRSKSNLFVGTNNTTLSNQQMGELNSQLALARSQKAESEAKARLIRNLLRSGQPIESSDVINSELIRRLGEQSATLRAQLAEQSSTLLGNHPRIKELKAQIADLDRQVRHEGEKLVRAFENDARIAGARVETLTQNLDQLKQQATSTNEQDVVLRSFEREAKAQRDLLESYLAKYREASARDSLGVMPAEARIISRAIVSNTPAFPKKLPIVLIATFATLFLSAGFITTGELLAGNVYRPAYGPADEVSPVTPVLVPVSTPTASVAPVHVEPVAPAPEAPAPEAPTPQPLVDIAPPAQPAAAPQAPTPQASAPHASAPAPQAPAPQASATPPAAAGRSTDRLASGLRRSGETARRITVVGVTRNIGTTSTAIALARALSEEGRVVLVDLALGAPNISAISSDPSAPGIAELIRGVASFRHIITRDRFSRAHVVAAGRAPADINSAMTSERLAIGMNALARSYDHVVVDAGAMPQIPLERFARLAPHAVLVAPGMPENVVSAARERLSAVGFTDITTFVDTPPLPDSGTRGPRTAAA